MPRCRLSTAGCIQRGGCGPLPPPATSFCTTSNYDGGMGARYRTQAINSDGGDGRAHVPGGLDVAVASPLGTNVEAGTNPEQLLALAWSTCLNATAQVIVAGARRTSVRVAGEWTMSTR